MAFVVVLFRGEEVTRRELNGPVVIGRAPECDISVRDIILSRRHCRLAPVEGANTWSVEDLGSKNGTRINGEPVQFAVLTDGTAIRIGKTQLKFYAGTMSGGHKPRKRAVSKRRPADPFEALSGTVADFEFVPEQPIRDLTRLPTPRPQPADPASYSSEDVYHMLTEIASSSWDSIYATASGPAAVAVAGQKNRPQPLAGVKVVGTDLPPRRRQVLPDPCLQVDYTEPATATDAIAVSSTLDALPTAGTRPATPAGGAKKPTWFAPVGNVLRQVKHLFTGR